MSEFQIVHNPRSIRAPKQTKPHVFLIIGILCMVLAAASFGLGILNANLESKDASRHWERTNPETRELFPDAFSNEPNHLGSSVSKVLAGILLVGGAASLLMWANRRG